MIATLKTTDDLLEENERLQLRLEEAEAVVEAIRNGIVDAVVVNSTPGANVYTLEGADRPYRLLVETMQQGVAMLNSDGVVLYCNPCLADLLKMSVEKVTGCTVNDFAAETDHTIVSDMVGSFENISVPKEVQLRRQDGTTFPAALAVSGLPLQKFCLLVTDLSQQQQYDELVVSKAALQDSEVRYRRLFETAKDGILILDTHTGKITDANPFMCELLEYSLDQFLGKELWEIGLFSDKSATEAVVRKLQEEGYVRYEHLPLETNRGLRVEVEIVANAYREDDHRVIQCNIRDITERSRLEKQLQAQTAGLADLHRCKDEFLAMLSHELRNPLAPIRNAIQLLRLQRDGTEIQKEAHSMIERQVAQLARLVDDLLEVSRITTGRIHLLEARIDLRGIVASAVEASRPQCGQKSQSIATALPKEPVWIYGDAMRLEQVVVNLLNNACKYTDSNGHIWVGLEQRGEEAVLRVRDNGIGIAPEVLPRIFDLFTQADKSLDRSQGGLGIGLALVQSLVNMHRGTVEALSTVGQGSEFIVKLPVVLSPSAPSAIPAAIVASPIRSLKVLVVDDNVDGAKGMAMLLRAFGHDARLAHDGASAMQVALEYVPEIVLLDIGLPVMNGHEVAKRVRLESSLKNVTLVALTGYGQESDRLRSREAGFDHHLVKPVDFANMQSILSAVASKAS